MDTDDLVQETVIRAVKRLDAFEPRHDGALQAYLRQAVMNRIRDEVRRAVRSPAETGLDDRQTDGGASPLDIAMPPHPGPTGGPWYAATIKAILASLGHFKPLRWMMGE